VVDLLEVVVGRCHPPAPFVRLSYRR